MAFRMITRLSSSLGQVRSTTASSMLFAETTCFSKTLSPSPSSCSSLSQNSRFFSSTMGVSAAKTTSTRSRKKTPSTVEEASEALTESASSKKETSPSSVAPPVVASAAPVVETAKPKVEVQKEEPVKAAPKPDKAKGEEEDDDSVEKVIGDPRGLIPVIVQIQELCDQKLDAPCVVVVGNQSGGKSSVIETIVGQDFLPKGTGMVTMRPLHMSLIRTEPGSAPYAKFDNVKEKIYDFSNDLKNRLLSKNAELGVSSEPIYLKIFSPDVYNVQLVDLPGYVSAVKRGQDTELPNQIREMCNPYISNPNNIILVIAPATDDLANNIGLREIQSISGAPERSMLVVTKPDVVVPQKVLELLNDNDYSTGLGALAVRGRSSRELESGTTFHQLIQKESAFYQSSGLSGTKGLRLGIITLRTVISDLLLEKMCHTFPEMLSQLDAILFQAKHNEDFLTSLTKQKDLKPIAKELELLVNQMHPSANTRLDFEKNLREGLTEAIRNVWDNSYKGNFSSFFGTLRKEEFDLHQKTLSPASKSSKSLAAKPSSAVTESLHLKVRSVLRNSEFEGCSSEPLEKFRSLTIYGHGNPEKIDDWGLSTATLSAMHSGMMSQYFRFFLPENISRHRDSWQNSLERTVTAVIEEQELIDKAQDILLSKLFAFVNDINLEHNSDQTQMARSFFKYLIEKITAREDNEAIDQGLRAIILRELRAVADVSEISAFLPEITGYPPADEFSGFFGVQNGPKGIAVYGEAWTKAYIEVVVQRCSDDIFRYLAVESLNPLIFKCLHYCLHLFNNTKIAAEAKKEVQRIAKLERYKEILTAAVKHYNHKI
eukprot:TRINITY_DN4049_c0_g1_i1.p1 TRINITY_DN4049_c0_g1~~TRINITY_DN4049_c0_g1_i1.p1  ORF type:complete len:858 (-),score=453.53 TRINITY_DN4049_c0_g1_i1:207-2690(-)